MNSTRIAYNKFIVSIIASCTFSWCLAQQGVPDAQARAATLGGKGVTVYAAGDIADCKSLPPAKSGAAKTASLIEAGLAHDKNAMVLTLGDNTYPVGLPTEFENCYQPTWGRFKQRTYPTPGNHDYYTPQAIGYYGYFDKAAGPNRRGYYSFDLGGWHIIALDSNLAPAAHAVQLDWLRADLAAHPARCTLAYWHHPLYSSGGHGSVPKMRDAWKLLADAGAELVLSGHDHDYERFAPQDADGRLDPARGIRQFVAGTGGAYPTPFLFTVAHSEARDSNRTGVLRLRLYTGGYGWEFVESTRLYSFGIAPLDHGSAACH